METRTQCQRIGSGIHGRVQKIFLAALGKAMPTHLASLTLTSSQVRTIRSKLRTSRFVKDA